MVFAAVHPMNTIPPQLRSLLSTDEVQSCNVVHNACILLQERLSTHRAKRLNDVVTQDHASEELRIIALYTQTLAHLDAACDGLCEISHC
jgi:hypothetical protein